MKVKPENLLLYAVTDRSWTQKTTLYDQVEKALKGGATFVQLREKSLDETAFLKEAMEIKNLCHRYGVPFVINDNVQIALKCDADGVHVGQSDMAAGHVRELLGPDKIIGVSAHTVEEALLAEENGADYLGSGSMFPTGTKDNVSVMKKETLQAICAAVKIPVVAIGGIKQSNMTELAGTGIAGVAVVSALFAAPDIQKAAEVMKTTLKQMSI